MHEHDLDFVLPPALIAQVPARPRDAARLLVPHDAAAPDRHVRDLPELLRPGDLLVVNDTRVIPAQIEAVRHRGGGSAGARIGLTLDMPLADGTWRALARNARRLAPGDRVATLAGALAATVEAVAADGAVRLRFDDDDRGPGFDAALGRDGRLALPPYIARPAGPLPDDATDYQTAFARHDGAVAAPTAGLHFTPELLDRLAAAGVGRVAITLHVGAGTFLPLRGPPDATHRLHAERGVVTDEAAAAIEATRARGGRVVAVGTTTLRLLESAGDGQGRVRPFDGETTLFIRPPHRVTTADMLLTNFHLPRSTLLLLVGAFAGIATARRAYAHAIAQGYRFYSYGDASLFRRADA